MGWHIHVMDIYVCGGQRTICGSFFLTISIPNFQADGQAPLLAKPSISLAQLLPPKSASLSQNIVFMQFEILCSIFAWLQYTLGSLLGETIICCSESLWCYTLEAEHPNSLTSFCSSSAPVFQSLDFLTSVYLGKDIVLTHHMRPFQMSGEL